MAVGRDGRPQAEAFLWEKSAKLRSDVARHGPVRPRAVAAVVVPSADRMCSQRRSQEPQQDVAEKPAAGSAAAVVSERRRASPAARISPRPAGPASGSERQASAAVPRAPAAPPSRPGRPASRGTRLTVARACGQASKVPAAPPRNERTASPRVRAMAALAESARASTPSTSAPSADCTWKPSVETEEMPSERDRAMSTSCDCGVSPAVIEEMPAYQTEHDASLPGSSRLVDASLPANLLAEASTDCTQAPALVEEARVVEANEDVTKLLEDPAALSSPVKDATSPVRGALGPPTLDDRPVATPTNSMRPFHFNLGSGMPPSRSVDVAEMWLRLARIALLELTKRPPASAIVGQPFARLPYNQCADGEEDPQASGEPDPQDSGEPDSQGKNEQQPELSGAMYPQQSGEAHSHSNPWMNMAYPDKSSADADCNGDADFDAEAELAKADAQFARMMAAAEQNDDVDEDVCMDPTSEGSPCEETLREGRAVQAWARILMRVFNVTMAGPGPPSGPEADEEEDEDAAPLQLPPGACDGAATKQGCAHICLGELMEESISWIDVDSEDDQVSPKAVDQMRAAEEAEEAEVEMPRGMKDVYRQQNAANAAGVQKCLSF